MAQWTEDGRQIPDDTPVEIPLNLRKGETEAMRIARAVSLEFSQQAEKKGYETWEESQDFDIEDDEDIFPQSQFELKEMAEEYLPDIPLDIEKTPDEVAIEEADNGKTQQQTEKNERSPEDPT